MKEGYGSFRVEEDYTWRDDIMTVTRRIINEIDDARFSNIADRFDVDLSEIREFLDAKRRKHLAPITNGDRLRAMSDEELAEQLSEIETGVKTYGEGVFSYWLDWLRQEAQP